MPIDAEDLFLKNLPLIDRAIGYICRRNRISRDEGEDFGSYVKFKLIEGNYGVIRKFEGRASFSTYITTVIQRMFFQYRVQMWGKWRPSAKAKRLGDKGVTVERLLTRDGYSYAEVVSMLTCGSDPRYTIAEIEAIYARLPLRQPRPMLVPLTGIAESEPVIETEDELFNAERGKKARHAAATVDTVMESMEPDDQLILKMRFWGGRKVPDIGRQLGLDDKRLYKRIDKLLSQLRLALERAGIAAADVAELLSHTDHEFSFAFSVAIGNAEIRHSKRIERAGESKRG
jgi:RNA polymerase sigma factor (sigma-70 family)